jgi:hypothetical protein
MFGRRAVTTKREVNGLFENEGSRGRVQNSNYAHITFKNSYHAMKTIAQALGTRSTRTVSDGPTRMMGAGRDTAGQLWGTTRTSEEAHLK